MVRLTIELDDDTYARLEALAGATSVAPERAAADVLAMRLQADQVSPHVHEIIQRQLDQYRDVFRRLGE